MFDFVDMQRTLHALPDRMESAVMAYGNTAAAQLQGTAMEERQWTDRTAQARQRIKGYCVKTNKSIRIYLAHGVDYGVYLEFAREKRYAILYPTLRREAPRIMTGFGRLLGGIR